MKEKNSSDTLREIYQWEFISTLITEHINKYGTSRIYGSRKYKGQIQLFIMIPFETEV